MGSPRGVNSASMWRSPRAGSTTVIAKTPEITALRPGDSDAVHVIPRKEVDFPSKESEAILDRAAGCHVEDPFDALILRTPMVFTREPPSVVHRDPHEPFGTPHRTAEARRGLSETDLVTDERIIADGHPLPSARARGAAGSLLGTAVDAFSDRAHAPPSTDAGRPLYERHGSKDGEKGVLLAERPGSTPITSERSPRAA